MTVPCRDYQPWLPSELTRLRSLVASGLSPSEIGRRIGRTAGAVELRVRRCCRSDPGFPSIIKSAKAVDAAARRRRAT